MLGSTPIDTAYPIRPGTKQPGDPGYSVYDDPARPLLCENCAQGGCEHYPTRGKNLTALASHPSGVHSVTQGATAVQVFPGGNLGPSLNAIAVSAQGETGWKGTAYSDGKLRSSGNLGFTGGTSVGFNYVAQAFGAIEEPFYSMTLGPPGTATVYDADTGSNLTVGGSAGNSTPNGSTSTLFAEDEMDPEERFLRAIVFLSRAPGELKRIFDNLELFPAPPRY
jgi:hypothetical protein